jgi:hypothetical protein
LGLNWPIYRKSLAGLALNHGSFHLFPAKRRSQAKPSEAKQPNQPVPGTVPGTSDLPVFDFRLWISGQRTRMNTTSAGRMKQSP